MTPNQPITISEEAKELAGEIWDFYGNASDHECTCYAKPESSCAYCNAWTRARALSELSIQEFYNSSREQDKDRIAHLEKQILELREAIEAAVQSAQPNRHEHPIMFAVWCKMKAALSSTQRELDKTK